MSAREQQQALGAVGGSQRRHTLGDDHDPESTMTSYESLEQQLAETRRQLTKVMLSETAYKERMVRLEKEVATMRVRDLQRQGVDISMPGATSTPRTRDLHGAESQATAIVTSSEPASGAGQHGSGDHNVVSVTSVNETLAGRDSVRTESAKLPKHQPKYSKAKGWAAFMADFEESVKLSGYSEEQQLALLRRSVPEESQRVLLDVVSVQDAKKKLLELFEPRRCPKTAMAEMQTIKQLPGEDIKVMAARLKEVAKRWKEALKMPQDMLDVMVTEQFKYAVSDAATRDHLLGLSESYSLDELSTRAAEYEDRRSAIALSEPSHQPSAADGECPKKVLYSSGETKSEIAALKEQMAELVEAVKQSNERRFDRRNRPSGKKSKGTGSGKGARSKKFDGDCFLCGEQGHMVRDCPQRAKSKPSSSSLNQ